jgi:hypothetical protein
MVFSTVNEVPPKSASVLDLTKARLNMVTDIFVPNFISTVGGFLRNLFSEEDVTLSGIPQPTNVIDFSDVEDMEGVVGRSNKEWTEAGFRSASGNKTEEALILAFFKTKAQVSGAVAHKNHCLNSHGHVSFIRFLLDYRLITHAQAIDLQKYSKKFQGKWAALVADDIIECALGVDKCKHGGNINTATDPFSFDLAPWGRDHITTALVQLRDAGQLYKVSGCKVREELGGLVAAPRRLAAAPCPPSISPSNRSPSSPPPTLSLHAGHRHLHGPGGGQHQGRPRG